jgi:KaiC/GvpD/RAD55 family RecA-like ATPase/DNA-binding NarL/FixJ family response regulator
MLTRPSQTQPAASSDSPDASEPQAPAGRLTSTGIPPLDERLGGLVRGRHYLLDGAPGSGKTSAALQFLGSGLLQGERALLLTQDDPADVLAQAEFLGFDLAAATANDALTVIRYRLDFARNYSRAADPGQVLAELENYIAEARPDRFVIDTISPFLEGGVVVEEALSRFPAFLEGLSSTTYLLAPGEFSDGHYSRLYDRVVSTAAGLFHFSLGDGQVRQMAVHKLRQPVKSTRPLPFVVRPGIGIVEHEGGGSGTELPPEVRRRIVVLDIDRETLPSEIADALARNYELVPYDSYEHAFAELAGARFGALLVGLDPRDPERVFQLARQLRRAGNGAPVLFLAPHQGLRGSTRARGLRAGGDDYLTDALSPEEFVERVGAACARGHRPAALPGELEPQYLQPRADDGSYPLLDAEAFRSAISAKLGGVSEPFFALVTVHPCGLEEDAAWAILCSHLRVGEGDLGGRTGDGRIALYLHDVPRRHVAPVLGRIAAAHPAMGPAEAMEVFTFPADRAEVERWLSGAERDGLVGAP